MNHVQMINFTESVAATQPASLIVGEGLLIALVLTLCAWFLVSNK